MSVMRTALEVGEVKKRLTESAFKTVLQKHESVLRVESCVLHIESWQYQ